MCNQIKIYRWLAVCFISAMCLLPCFDKVVATADIDDGTYSIDYVILRGDNESVSIANDYFEKPATLIVENGEQYIQFWINHSQWVKELQSPLGDNFVDVDIVEEDEENDLRLVQFKVDGDLSEPIEFKMHVYIDSMDPVYDHRYTVRFDFDIDSLQEIEAKEVFKTNHEQDDDTESDETAVTQNSDDSNTKSISITMTIIIGIAIILFAFVIWKFMKNKMNRKVNVS